MGGFPILSAMTFLPLAGALIIMLVRAATAGSRDASSSDAEGRTALLAGLIISGATFHSHPSPPGWCVASPPLPPPGGAIQLVS